MADQAPIIKVSVADYKFTCPSCGGAMIQKSKSRLIIAGFIMIAAAASAFAIRWFLLPGIILALTGIYLLVWATLGKARWCRNCKTFSTGRSENPLSGK